MTQSRVHDGGMPPLVWPLRPGLWCEAAIVWPIEGGKGLGDTIRSIAAPDSVQVAAALTGEPRLRRVPIYSGLDLEDGRFVNQLVSITICTISVVTC